MQEPTTELVIEKGIPLPPRGATGVSSVLRSMVVGDSVLLPGTKTTTNLGGFFSKLKPMKFAARTVDGGTRIWRIQ